MARQTITYQPALDGVRALAVLAVLLFHGGVTWMTGGYLGVSVFFTLSGFLITTLLLTEHERSGTVKVAAFYTRRARRLLPASLTCLVGVCIAAWLGWFRGVANLRRDVLGALFQVFNWVKLLAGESYADLTTLHSGFRKPLEHYWSLAIEEQFYWVWPVAFLGLMALSRRWRVRPIVLVGGLAAVAALAAPVIARGWGPDAAYWSTPARIFEILAGAVVACWVAGRPVLPLRLAWLAPATLAALAAACVLFPSGHGPAYDGYLPLVAAASAALIAGLQVPGPVRQFLSTRPLVALGKVSYGVYLYHWPVFVLIDRHAWHVPIGVLLVVKSAITAALAIASYVLIEKPVRTSEWLLPRRTLVGALAGVVVVTAAVTLVPVTSKYYGVDRTLADKAAIGSESVAPLVPLPTSAPGTAPTGSGAPGTGPGTPTVTSVGGTSVPLTTVPLVPPRPVRIAVIGDSTAEATGNGLVQWAAANPSLAQVVLVTGAGCGLATGGYLEYLDTERDLDRQCGPYLHGIMPTRIKRLKPDVVMILTTTWDVADRRLVKGGPVLPVTDPAVRAATAASFQALTDELFGFGVQRVVWVREPIPIVGMLGPADKQGDPARHQVLYGIMDEMAAKDPRVRVAGLAAWVDQHGLTYDTVARPDAVHWSAPVALRIAAEFLGPLLIRAALT